MTVEDPEPRFSDSPAIEYANTIDGVPIAYWRAGQGAPLVHLPTAPLIHSAYVRDVDLHRRWFERLAAIRTVVFYDQRGFGLSGGPASDLRTELMLRDIDAVVDTASQQQIDIFATSQTVPLALEFARTRPEHVARLVLWQPFADWRRWVGDTAPAAIRSLMTGDVRRWAAMMSPFFLGTRRRQDDVKQLEYHLERIVTEDPSAFAKNVEQSKDWRVEGRLADVKAKTLVLVRPGIVDFPLAAAREVASELPNAAIRSLGGDAFAPCAGDQDEVSRVITAFLEEPPVASVKVSRVVLTDRQRQVALLVARGLSNKEVADELGISPHTVIRHLSRIFAANGMANRAELASRIGRDTRS